MSIQVTCPTCGARLVYKGTTSKVKPCPKCQTPITFGTPAPLAPPSAPVIAAASPEPLVEAPIAAEAVPEPKQQPKAEPAKPAATPKKPSPVIWILLAGLAAAFGGLIVLMVCCAGVAVIVMHGGRRESLASDSAAPYYDAKGSGYDDKSGGSVNTSYTGYIPTDSASSNYADPATTAASAPQGTADNSYSQDSGTYGGGLFGGIFGGNSAEDDAAEAAAQYEEARREAQRQINADYWANRAEQAASNGNEDEASRYRNYAENP